MEDSYFTLGLGLEDAQDMPQDSWNTFPVDEVKTEESPFSDYYSDTTTPPKSSPETCIPATSIPLPFLPYNDQACLFPGSPQFPAEDLSAPAVTILQPSEATKKAAIAAKQAKEAICIPIATAEKSKKSRAAKKRKLEDGGAEPCGEKLGAPLAGLGLTTEVVQTITSVELESFISKLQQDRPLTAPETKVLKQTMRTVKNRESAQASRQRKRDYVQQLVAQVTELHQETNRLGHQLSQALSDNHIHVENIKILKESLTRAGANQPQLLSCPEVQFTAKPLVLPSDCADNTPPSAPSASPKTRGPSAAVVKTSVMLAAFVLFSFALYLGPGQNFSPKPFQPTNFDVPPQVNKPLHTRALMHATQNKLRQFLPKDDSVHLNFGGRSGAPHSSNDPTSLGEAKVLKTWEPQNMSYLMCAAVKKFDPVIIPAPDDDMEPQPQRLGLLFPFSAFNDSAGKVPPEKDDLVELTVNIVGVSVIPRHILPDNTEKALSAA